MPAITVGIEDPDAGFGEGLIIAVVAGRRATHSPSLSFIGSGDY